MPRRPASGKPVATPLPINRDDDCGAPFLTLRMIVMVAQAATNATLKTLE
jgi:hypothetical protein